MAEVAAVQCGSIGMELACSDQRPPPRPGSIGPGDVVSRPVRDLDGRRVAPDVGLEGVAQYEPRFAMAVGDAGDRKRRAVRENRARIYLRHDPVGSNDDRPRPDEVLTSVRRPRGQSGERFRRTRVVLTDVRPEYL